jgi:crossover junction endodeoxyribonuclease RusA
MHTLTFPAPGKLLNLNDRTHWRPKAELNRMWRQAAFIAATNAQYGMLPPCTVACCFPVRSLKVRRDPSNWYATVKPIVDGLTDAGLWPDDTAEWVATVEPTFHKGGMVVVELTERTT